MRIKSDGISFFLFSLVLFTVWFGSAGRVSACPVYDFTPTVCEMYGKSKAIFAGRAVKINEQLKDKDGDYDEVYFQVKESFLGVKKNVVVKVRMNAGNVEYCGFKSGESYLVYAYEDTPNNFFSDANRSRLLAEADEDLNFLRSAGRKDSGSRIYGTVKQFIRSSLEKDNAQPLSMLALKIERSGAENQAFEVFTDANGKYEVEGLSAGEYRITLNLITETNFSNGGAFSGSGAFVKVGARGCVKQDFEVNFTGEIKGKVLDGEGNPVKSVTVEAIPADFVKPDININEGRELSRTNENGVFVISNVAPGRYILAVGYTIPPDTDSPFPATFYPNALNRGEAAIVEIAANQKIGDLEFRLPAHLAEKKIKGAVVWADGRPASGVDVYLKEDEYTICCVMKNVKTDANGNFVLIGYENRRYRIWTSSENKVNRKTFRFFGASSIFTPTNDAANFFRIVLNPTTKHSLSALEELEDGERAKTK